MSKTFLHIAIPTPLRQLFTYTTDLPVKSVGGRVRVSFGRQHLVGVIAAIDSQNRSPVPRLKAVDAILDDSNLWPDELWAMLKWAADYYHHPLGEVLATAMPAALRQGKPASYPERSYWYLTEQGKRFDPTELKRAPRQQAILQYLQQQSADSSEAAIDDQQLRETHPGCSDALNRLTQKGLLTVCRLNGFAAKTIGETQPGPSLNEEQQNAVTAIIDRLDHYAAFLLEGVTGSGKTEVYLQCIQACVNRGRQALVLIPEIGLTPQMIQRFRKRLACQVGVLHSGLTDSERMLTWLAARDGKLDVILGTRSAIFTPLLKPGLIIIDEEHDASFKQQDGFRYSARDLAIWRAHHNSLPIVLGSATPSLESLANAQRDRYQLLTLTQRAGNAIPPKLHLLDMRSQPIEEGLSDRLLQVMRQHLEQNQQVLLFLNRRGFSPTLMCHDCGWIANCQRCDTHMTYHQLDRRLRCHHCGAERVAEKSCPQCQGSNLLNLGAGTERIEAALKARFPEVDIVRIDRDTTRRKGSLEALLDRVRNGQRQILIGTQMLAKGHHFPNVTMVGIVDADQGLHSPEFRAPERMAQLILQVAGRAGRAEQPGEVYIQTHHPDHPHLLTLIQSGYPEFARALLAEREETGLPPFSAMALFRAEAVDRHAPIDFLQQVSEQLRPLAQSQVQLFGPLPAPMEKRAGRYRAQLVVSAPGRAALQQFLSQGLPAIDKLKNNKVRWSLDVDPIDTY
ncbi:MAG: primosomal protein N' [Thioalkalispiraceae bacterium]|jgi:primosomal protein N' (replication factor Y)